VEESEQSDGHPAHRSKVLLLLLPKRKRLRCGYIRAMTDEPTRQKIFRSFIARLVLFTAIFVAALAIEGDLDADDWWKAILFGAVTALVAEATDRFWGDD
jgi:hypothetical protein